MKSINSCQDKNKKKLEKYTEALETEVYNHNIEVKNYQTKVQEHNQENYGFIQSLKDKMIKMNEQLESKTELLNKTTKSLSKIQDSLNTKSEEITTSITSLITTISTLTKSTESASSNINSLITTQHSLLHQTSSLSTKISSFNSVIHSKYTTSLTHHLQLLSKSNSKLTTLQYIQQSHLSDKEKYKTVKEEVKQRRKNFDTGIVEEKEDDGVWILKYGVEKMKQLSASALVLPLNEQLRMGHIAEEYRGFGFENDEKLKNACRLYKQDHFRLRTGLTTIAPTESPLFDKIILACGPIFTDDQST